MLQINKKWRITIHFGTNKTSFLIHDNHYSNVIRKLGEIDFDMLPEKIVIDRLPDDNPQQMAGITIPMGELK